MAPKVSSVLLPIQEPQAHRPQGWPLFRLGFRPFYLAAAAMALFNVAWWISLYSGWLSRPQAIPPLLWHAHEMLFGFAGAVIAGFLLTASRAWTRQQTPRGHLLAALVLLWLLARLAALGPWPSLFAVLDLALLPAVGWVLWRCLQRARQWRNLPIVGIVGLLSLINAGFHLSLAGWMPGDPLQHLRAALAVVVMLVMVMAGRVIPGFSMNGTPGLRITRLPWFERVSISVGGLALAGWILPLAPAMQATLLLIAALVHAVRLWRWQPWRVVHQPMLWVLHGGYAWIVLGMLALAWASWNVQSPTLGVHALTVGALGMVILGMITRTARGHTGRRIEASRLEVLAFFSVVAAAVGRVLGPALWPTLTPLALAGSAIFWMLGFGLYLWVYTPWLLQTRVDGMDG